MTGSLVEYARELVVAECKEEDRSKGENVRDGPDQIKKGAGASPPCNDLTPQ